jgi:5,10-methylenetetrahydromethanopterin reductase
MSSDGSEANAAAIKRYDKGYGIVEISVGCDGRNPVPQLIDQVRTAEAAGATAFWVSSHLFLRDPFTMAGAVLAATTWARVTLLALSPYVLHPVHMAMAAATLDELAPGRVTLCIGAGAPDDLVAAGVEPTRRVRTLHETIDVTRALLAGEQVTYQGAVFRIQARRLVLTPQPIPIVLAASGIQTLALAGAVADGVVLSTGASVEFVRWSLDHVERGAKGRPIRRTGLVYAAAAVWREVALGRYRRNLAITLRGDHHARNVAVAGGIIDHTALRQAVAEEDWARAEHLMTDDLVRRHTATGTPDEMRARLAAYHAAGLDELVLQGLSTPAETAATLHTALGVP